MNGIKKQFEESKALIAERSNESKPVRIIRYTMATLLGLGVFFIGCSFIFNVIAPLLLDGVSATMK